MRGSRSPSARVSPELVDAQSWAVFIKTEQTNRLELVRAINAPDLPVGPFVEIEKPSDSPGG